MAHMLQLECCGAVNYTDYRAIFSNFSVPVSCCNSTHPLASNCSEIVVNTQQTINQTNLIYSKVSLFLPTMLSLYILWPRSALVIGLCVSLGVFLHEYFQNYCWCQYHHWESTGIISITKLVSNSCTFYLL